MPAFRERPSGDGGSHSEKEGGLTRAAGVLRRRRIFARRPGEFGRRAEPSVSRRIDWLAVGVGSVDQLDRRVRGGALRPQLPRVTKTRSGAIYWRPSPAGSQTACCDIPGQPQPRPSGPAPERLALRPRPRGGLSLFHPAVANWFAESFVAPTPAQAEAWPAIKARSPHPHRSADRLGQDARRLPGGDRRTGAAGSRRAADRRNARRLRFPAQGAVERHPSQPRGPAGRHPGTAAPESGFPRSKSAPGSGRATRLRPSANGCAADRRTFS